MSATNTFVNSESSVPFSPKSRSASAVVSIVMIGSLIRMLSAMNVVIDTENSGTPIKIYKAPNAFVMSLSETDMEPVVVKQPTAKFRDFKNSIVQSTCQ